MRLKQLNMHQQTIEYLRQYFMQLKNYFLCTFMLRATIEIWSAC